MLPRPGTCFSPREVSDGTRARKFFENRLPGNAIAYHVVSSPTAPARPPVISTYGRSERSRCPIEAKTVEIRRNDEARVPTDHYNNVRSSVIVVDRLSFIRGIPTSACGGVRSYG
jgi:hypothetical protein